ncbi:hypothetical protein AALA78_01915 [Lachnospiraceae bacterium 42-17]|jgi:hypothetical protein|nr:hypothetical protein [Dorea sp.]
MFKPKTLLKVVSILLMIGGVLGIFGTILSYAMLPKLSDIPGIDMSLITSALTPLNLIMSLISGISAIAAGFFGFSGKSVKWLLITAGIYTVILLISVVQTVMNGMATAFMIVDFIVPSLYWWGFYQSK